ncbi:MAG: flagellar export chaperone FlgN [Deltaproteobacteria bacterium]|nr:flagellar export chaperone FlgN [Nocardioidaceae bacterium]MCB9737000.1 flagellar export chaperone FlgN [Deltaproteobacteria bacterium]
MRAVVASLCEALEVQTAVLDALVSASQRQLVALVGYRAELRSEPSALEEVSEEIRRLTDDLGDATNATRDRAEAVVDVLSLPVTLDDGLSAVVRALPEGEREVATERVSELLSLTQALAELQHVNQVHAKRGLQVISAWWALATSGEPAAEATVYTKRGRSRTKLVTGASSLEINI